MRLTNKQLINYKIKWILFIYNIIYNTPTTFFFFFLSHFSPELWNRILKDHDLKKINKHKNGYYWQVIQNVIICLLFFSNTFSNLTVFSVVYNTVTLLKIITAFFIRQIVLRESYFAAKTERQTLKLVLNVLKMG